MEGTDLRWRKASYSSNGGANCVEVADHGSQVLVRDTKDRQGPALAFSTEAWRRFAEQVKRSLALDLPARRSRRGHSRIEDGPSRVSGMGRLAGFRGVSALAGGALSARDTKRGRRPACGLALVATG